MPPDANNRSWTVIAVIAACLLTSIVIVCLRFYVRRVIIRKLGIDDWVLAATLVSYIGVAVVTAVCTKFGLGRHIDVLSIRERSAFLKLIWIASIGYGAVIVFMKMTFLFQYRRVFPLPKFQRVCNIFLVFIVIWAVAGTIGAMLNCQPVKRNWDPLASRDCAERTAFWIAMGIVNVLTDALIFVLPLPLLKSLPLPKLQKGILMAVFSLGFFTCAISIIRLTTLRASTLSGDPTWTMTNTVVWSMAEVTCAVICACVPTLRPLVQRSAGWRRHFPNEFSRPQRSRTRNRRTPELYDMDTFGTQNTSSSRAKIDIKNQSGDTRSGDGPERPQPCHLPDLGPTNALDCL